MQAVRDLQCCMEDLWHKAVLRPAAHTGRKDMQHQQNTAPANGAQSPWGAGEGGATMTGYKSRDRDKENGHKTDSRSKARFYSAAGA